jgi:glycosyltransferase involved in cell wall biosynthesis
MVEEILLRQETLIVNYHNITPAHYFDQLAPNLAFELRQGREQLSRMAKRARMAIADSEFNASELRALGFANVLTIPVLADFGKRVERKPRTEPVLRGSQWLFVGRLVPNKAQHDLIVALAAYRELYDSEATLTLVGGGLPSYQKKLQDLLSELGISEAVRMVGVVSEEEKRDYFRSADIYLSLSDHEGYGVPLVEAMHHGLPVVAFDVAAVGETVGKSGLLLLEKKPTNVAAVIFEVLSDPKVYQSIVASGLDRSKELSYHYSAKAFIEALSPLLYD